MKNHKKNLELKLDRTINASPEEVFAAWLNPKIPGTPWHEAKKLLLYPEVNGLFYWLFKNGTPHYGRFMEVKKSSRIKHTWMSPYTKGIETTVTVTFKKKGSDTFMTLVHTGFPDSESLSAHDDGWKYFLDKFPKQFKEQTKKK